MNHADHLPLHTLSIEPWGLSELSYLPDQAPLHESLLTLGNGRIGVRGAHEEGAVWSGTFQNDVFINGFYESEPIVYPESAYGFAKTNQFMVRVPNATPITFNIDGETFDPKLGQIQAYRRHLDLQTGVLTRSFEWVSPKGQHVRVQSERLVSLTHTHLMAQRYSVTLLNALNGSSVIEIRSAISNQAPQKTSDEAAIDDPRVGASLSGQLQFAQHHELTHGSAFIHHTHHSGLSVATATVHQIDNTASQRISHTIQHDEHVSAHTYTIECDAGQTITLDKYSTYCTANEANGSTLLERACAELDTAQTLGFDALLTEQRDYLADFWRSSHVEIGGDDALQQGMRFSAFHLLQSVGRDGKTNIAAKGVTGAGYDGHYFWDTEIYVLPFFLHTRPDIARQLLQYRAHILPAARERAREMAHPRGALYPWRTITGPECSSYFPAGTAQYHINADIAYATALYTRVTGDWSFIVESGAEMIFETARIWPDLGHFSDNGEFGLYTVTGPDEYTAIVNNNLFTNLMARHHLRFALEVAEYLHSHHPERYAELRAHIGLSDEELALWQRMAAQMKVPFDAERGLHAQDDAFFDKPLWDFANTPKANYPLLLHYHPLVIYRHQVCKQPDVVLALLLLGDEFTTEEKRCNYDYYEAITTHDSSLSSCIFSIMASEIGYGEKAYDYFMQTARLDLDNLHHNTQHGLHCAALAGSWMALVYGFAGMRSNAQTPQFTPFLPRQWTHYQFVVRLHGYLLQVRVELNQVTYQLLDTEDAQATLSITHYGKAIDVTREPVSLSIVQTQ